MRRIVRLDLSKESSLQWGSFLFQEDEEVFWHLDFGFQKSDFSDSSLFFSYALAVETFVSQILTQFSEKTRGVLFYQGDGGIVDHFIPTILEKRNGEMDLDDPWNQFLFRLEAASFLGNYLHRLASFLPETVPVYVLFEGESSLSLGEQVYLFSQDRFWFFRLSWKENQEKRGVLLPQDSFLTPDLLRELSDVLKTISPCRIIPELRLSELWDGLDVLYTFPNTISVQGKRQMLGFSAAGGEVISSDDLLR